MAYTTSSRGQSMNSSMFYSYQASLLPIYRSRSGGGPDWPKLDSKQKSFFRGHATAGSPSDYNITSQRTW